MISGVNLTTGPVGITGAVQQALAAPPISHRSGEFQRLYNATCDKLSAFFHVKDTYLLTGSGTLANEVMLQQIKAGKTKGVILSNGEFGERLVRQARRIGMDFIPIEKNWGEQFDATSIGDVLQDKSVDWLLFCHCETSTGVINDLDKLTQLASDNNCACFVDCMSTVGTSLLDLSQVTMATASSGKGLASIPGIAVVFSNMQPTSGEEIPTYLDLSLYKRSEGIPFTISSNLVKALNVSIDQKLNEQQILLTKEYKDQCYQQLSSSGLVMHSTSDSAVITIDTLKHPQFVSFLLENGIEFSYNSGYLRERNWCQLAFFGYFEEYQLQIVLRVLSNVLNKTAGTESRVEWREHLQV